MTTDELKQLKKVNHVPAIEPLLAKRFSPRVFAEQMLTQEQIDSLFEAARWTPSSYNRQPWEFIYAVKGTEGFEKIGSCLVEANTWAKESPLLIVGCRITEDEQGVNQNAAYDLGASVMSLTVQATSLGLYVHQMGGFDREKAVEVLEIREPLKPHVVIAVGHIGDYSTAAEKLVERDVHAPHRKEKIARQI